MLGAATQTNQKTQSRARIERYRDKVGETGRKRMEGYVDGTIAERFEDHKKSKAFNNNGETLDDLLTTVFTILNHPLFQGTDDPLSVLENLTDRNRELRHFLETQTHEISDLLRDPS